MKTEEKEINEALEYIKSKHNGEIPYKYGANECARLMAAYHKQKMEEKCEWKYDEDYEYYNTSCGAEYGLIDGTLEENEHHHCPFCGGRIILTNKQ